MDSLSTNRDPIFEGLTFFLVRVKDPAHFWDDEEWWDPIPCFARDMTRALQRFREPQVVYQEKDLRLVDCFARQQTVAGMGKRARRRMVKTGEWPKKALKMARVLMKDLTAD